MSDKDFSCYYCGGEIISQRQDVDFRWGEELVVVKDVPVLICNQCGEKYYSARISEKLDGIVARRKKAKEFLKIPVFKWSHIAGIPEFA